MVDCVPYAKPLLHLILHCVLQLDSMTSCRAGLTLLVAQDSNESELMEWAKQAALSANLLQRHQLTLGISIEPVTNTTIVLPASVLRQLGTFLCCFDTYTIPTDQPAAIRTTNAGVSSFTSINLGLTSAVTVNHILDLSDSDPSDCTFCIATDHPDPWHPSPVNYRNTLTAVVASMANLTKLHLTIADSFSLSGIDFQPLAQLLLLEDLALQVFGWREPECCSGVLRSNRQTLQFVTLTADSWTAATYRSLQQIVQLKTLTISIINANTAQAQALKGVTAELFRLTLQNIHGAQLDDTLQALQDNEPAGVHELTLRNQQCCDTCRPPLLPFLQSLTLRECRSLTGKSLPSYPRVTQLVIIDCPGVTGDGLQHIIRKALPALQDISLHISARNDQAMHMSLRALNALHFGQNLRHIDLRGVSGLTLDRLAKFDYTMQRKQRQKKAQPYVTVLMPRQPLDKPTAVFDSLPTICLPNLFQLPAPCSYKLLITYQTLGPV